MERLAIQERHRVRVRVDARNGIARAVLLEPVRLLVEAEPLARRTAHFARAILSLLIKDDGRRRRALRYVDAVEIEVAVRRVRADGLDALDRDFLHELLIVGVDGVETVDEIVQFARRRGVAQGEERAKIGEALLRLRALDGLRLVDDDDGMRRRDDIDGAAAAELVELHADAPRVLAARVERLDVDDHHADARHLRERLDLREPPRVVDEELHLPAVLHREMLLRLLEGLVDALADGDARHDDDELLPAVVLPELVHRLDIGIRLARARLHLDSELRIRPELVGMRELMRLLHRVQVLAQDGRRERERRIRIADRREQRRLTRPPRIDEIAAALALRLTAEHIDDGARRVLLELLMLELELHRRALLKVPGARCPARAGGKSPPR